MVILKTDQRHVFVNTLHKSLSDAQSKKVPARTVLLHYFNTQLNMRELADKLDKKGKINAGFKKKIDKCIQDYRVLRKIDTFERCFGENGYLSQHPARRLLQRSH